VLAFSRDSEHLVSREGSEQGQVLFRVGSGEKAFTLPPGDEYGSRYQYVAIDGGHVAATADDSKSKTTHVRVYRLDSGEELARFHPGEGQVVGLALSPSGARLAVSLATERQRGDNTCSVVVWRLDRFERDGAFA